MINLEPIIEARGVEKFYEQPDKRRIEVIAPINITIDRDKIIALLGPSGCGKSTLLKILIGQVQPDGGKVSIRDGIKLGDLVQAPHAPGGAGTTATPAS